MKPKTLFFDIETAPSRGYYFQLYKEGNILWTDIPWYMLSFSWKWLGKSKVHVSALTDFKSYNKDKTNDKELVETLWKLFDEADILIAHHGDPFDIKKTNARFIKHGMKPPTPYTSIDTRKVAKRRFKFDSNKLNDLGQYLGVGRKLKHTGFDLWKDCMDGDLTAWKLMKNYNKQDVVLLEKVYEKMTGWVDNHPNKKIAQNIGTKCPNCLSTRTQKRGFSTTAKTKSQRYQCQKCGAWFKGAKIK